ncbi:hypothetical protein DY000_02058953 [Brassica cretica]|uniref:Uncharacterized protein n=1 Tax=Brassica cretica TaxID=69181 RepID=A0ABQ7B4A1_BRACR|nr:hypothetical protein DY000_02058953 [Brassica cretica]
METVVVIVGDGPDGSKAGRLEDRVVTSLLRFWEARNVKKSGELMSVDFIFLNEKCRRNSKIMGKKFTIGLIPATPLNEHYGVKT